MDKKELAERYEATGEEAAYLEALRLYEPAIANGAQSRGYELDSLWPKQELARLRKGPSAY